MAASEDQYHTLLPGSGRLTQLTNGANSLRAELIRGVIGTGSLKVASKFLALGSSVVLARLLGAEGYGIYGFAMAMVALLAIPVDLGLPQFLVRKCAIYLRRNDLASMKGLLRRANQAVLLSALIIGAGAALVIEYWVPSVGAISPLALLSALALLPLIALNGIRSAALRGLGRVVLGQFPELVLRPLVFIVLLVGIVFVTKSLNPIQAILANAIAMSVVFAFGSWMLHQSLPHGFRPISSRFSDKQWLAGALPFLVLGGAHLVTQNTDVLMLGILANAEDVGVYRVASQTAMLVVLGLMMVNPVIAPYLARLHDARDTSNIQRVVTLAAQGSLLFALPVAFVFVFAGGWMLTFVFGESFAGGQVALSILVIGQLVNAGMGSVAMILNMTGHAWYSSAGVFVAAIVNVLLNLALIPPFGIEGAAMATAASLVVWNLLLAYWVYRFTALVSMPVNFRASRRKSV